MLNLIIFNKQGGTIKIYALYKEKEIEIANQCTYLGFTFIFSTKKPVGIEILIRKDEKAWFSIQTILSKLRGKNNCPEIWRALFS